MTPFDLNSFLLGVAAASLFLWLTLWLLARLDKHTDDRRWH
jgi:hypothetical protein